MCSVLLHLFSHKGFQKFVNKIVFFMPGLSMNSYETVQWPIFWNKSKSLKEKVREKRKQFSKRKRKWEIFQGFCWPHKICYISTCKLFGRSKRPFERINSLNDEEGTHNAYISQWNLFPAPTWHYRDIYIYYLKMSKLFDIFHFIYSFDHGLDTVLRGWGFINIPMT